MIMMTEILSMRAIIIVALIERISVIIIIRIADVLYDKGWALRYHGPRGHFPCTTGNTIGGVDRRNRCIICKTKGTLGCRKCGVTLCCVGDGENCFSRFHTEREIRMM